MGKCKDCGGDCDTCATCNQPQCAHHEFVKIDRPPGCVCEAGEWRDPTSIPAVCKAYAGNGADTNCSVCEHDRECHEG